MSVRLLRRDPPRRLSDDPPRRLSELQRLRHGSDIPHDIRRLLVMAVLKIEVRQCYSAVPKHKTLDARGSGRFLAQQMPCHRLQ